ncbi:MAG: hypothetical protein D084_Lepto4C00197G0002 [Leptospirillum sp. Group IV 'UBA BS']|nr:MAG: hypothetical protein D084_Lepto4C00197G0002 [Leptospirillum sp. Group IV 'UBA BS']MCL5286317.1 hypothetical protein [Nitrospirota bacterium]
MENREKEFDVIPSVVPEQVFSVWVDEGGSPMFLEDPDSKIPSECFVHVDPRRIPAAGDYLLVSTLDGLFFGRTSEDGAFVRIEDRILPLEAPLLVLGVVIAGFEWFALP